MNETTKKILLIIAEFIFLSLLTTIVPLAIYYDIIYMANDRLLENSATEWLQVLFLFISAMLFLSMAIKDKAARGLYALASGLFISMIIREGNNYFNHLPIQEIWETLVVITLGTAIIIARRNKNTFIAPLIKYSDYKPFIFIMIGLVITLVFSRIFGTGSLWNPILEFLTTDAKVATIKNIVQEGLELLGYSIIAYGSFLQTRLYKHSS